MLVKDYIYIYDMYTMCPPGCHHNGFMATPELGHRMYILSYVEGSVYIYIYIFFFFFLWQIVYLYSSFFQSCFFFVCPTTFLFCLTKILT